MKRPTLVILALCALTPFAVAACGSSDDSAAEAQAQVCSATADIEKQVADLKSMTGSTVTVDAVKTDLEAIKNDVETIAGAVPELAQEKKQQVQAANQTFTTQAVTILNNVLRSQSVSDAKAQLASAVSTLETTYKQTLGTLGCSS